MHRLCNWGLLNEDVWSLIANQADPTSLLLLRLCNHSLQQIADRELHRHWSGFVKVETEQDFEQVSKRLPFCAPFFHCLWNVESALHCASQVPKACIAVLGQPSILSALPVLLHQSVFRLELSDITISSDMLPALQQITIIVLVHCQYDLGSFMPLEHGRTHTFSERYSARTEQWQDTAILMPVLPCLDVDMHYFQLVPSSRLHECSHFASAHHLHRNIIASLGGTVHLNLVTPEWLSKGTLSLQCSFLNLSSNRWSVAHLGPCPLLEKMVGVNIHLQCEPETIFPKLEHLQLRGSSLNNPILGPHFPALQVLELRNWSATSEENDTFHNYVISAMDHLHTIKIYSLSDTTVIFHQLPKLRYLALGGSLYVAKCESVPLLSHVHVLMDWSDNEKSVRSSDLWTQMQKAGYTVSALPFRLHNFDIHPCKRTKFFVSPYSK